MIQRKPQNRLGYNGINEIKDHPWLKFYPWKDLYQKKIESPFIPKSNDNFDKKYCQGPDKIGNETLERYQNYYKKDALSDVFINYSFENILTTKGNIQNLTNQNKKNMNLDGNNITKSQNFNSSLSSFNSSTKKIISNSQSAQMNNNNIQSYNNKNLKNNNNINQLLKSKMKVTESIYLNNKISSSISNIRNTPNQSKINSANNINLLKTKNKQNFSTASLTGKQINAIPFRFFNEKSGEKLPFIDPKNSTKHISSHSMMSRKILNSPTMNINNNHPIKALNKYSSLSNNNSNGNSSSGNLSINFLHRRSGSTNLPNKY